VNPAITWGGKSGQLPATRSGHRRTVLVHKHADLATNIAEMATGHTDEKWHHRKKLAEPPTDNHENRANPASSAEICPPPSRSGQPHKKARARLGKRTELRRRMERNAGNRKEKRKGWCDGHCSHLYYRRSGRQRPTKHTRRWWLMGWLRAPLCCLS